MIGGHVGQQGIRFGSNLILARLLAPEAFGLMAIVTAVLIGINMFSDMGLGPSVIQSKRGDDPDFLNTAWTLQIIRGFGLWLCMCILTWPISMFYGEPALLWLIPIVGLSAIGSGFGSMSLLTLRRHVDIRPLIMRDIGASVASLVVMVTLAYFTRSVWALVVGALVRATTLSISSYFLPSQVKHRLVWNKDCAREMFRFGRWIFISTALTFVQQQGDKLILGKFLGDMGLLGVYSIAAMLSRSAIEVMLKLNQQVLFPVYSNIANNASKRLKMRLMHARGTLFAIFLPFMCTLVVFGSDIVGLLYNENFVHAGWMLQVLSAGAIGTVITSTSAGVLLAVGDSLRYMIVQISRSALLILAMLIGGYYGQQAEIGGFVGVVLGVAASRLIDYPIVAWAVRRHKLWQPSLDFAGYAIAGGVCLAGLYFTGQI